MEIQDFFLKLAHVYPAHFFLPQNFILRNNITSICPYSIHIFFTTCKAQTFNLINSYKCFLTIVSAVRYKDIVNILSDNEYLFGFTDFVFEILHCIINFVYFKHEIKRRTVSLFSENLNLSKC